MRHLFLVFVTLAVPVGVYACGENSPSSPAPVDGSAALIEASTPDVVADTSVADTSVADTSVADTSVADTSVADTSTNTIRCTQADFNQTPDAGGGDLTAFSGINITFPTGPNPAQYTNHCAKVKAGTTVSFVGSFSRHPLQPFGGDTPNPIPATSTDAVSGFITVTVTSLGTFGYQCASHPSVMFGALQVVP